MSIDIASCLGAVTRTVAADERDGQPIRVVSLSRSYGTSIGDLWDALTSTERLPRWFARVDGDFRLGGHYQIKDNASGSITACEPPRSFNLTWEFGGAISWVELRLEPEDVKCTRLTLSHIAPLDDFWETYGSGAAGVGWDLGLYGLACHVDDPAAVYDEAAFLASPEAQTLILGSSEAWGQSDIAAGADPEQAQIAAQRTGAFYTGSEAENA